MTIVLDTNVLLHDPQSIYAFPKDKIIILVGVIEELDKFKKDPGERGYNARESIRLLDTLLKDSGTCSVTLHNGGTLDVISDDVRVDGNHYFDDILLEYVGKFCDIESTTIVSQDCALRVKAFAKGYKAIGYSTLKVKGADRGYPVVLLDEEAFENDLANNTCSATGKTDYIIVQNIKNPMQQYPAKRYGTIYKQVHSQTCCGIAPRNIEQCFAVDALLDRRVDVVTLQSTAGSGKTLLCLAAALQLVKKQNKYDKIIVTRPTVALENDIGFLPGNMEEKMEPWMQPIMDALEVIQKIDKATEAGKKRGKKKKEEDAEDESSLIEIMPLTYIRGRSLSNAFIILEESQNMSLHAIKSFLTRIGDNCKVVINGCLEQIDNPYLDVDSCGLGHVIEAFKECDNHRYVELKKCERGIIADMANKLL